MPASIAAVGARATSILASFLLTVVVAQALTIRAAGTFFVVFTATTIAASAGRFGVDNLATKILGSDGDHRDQLRRGWQLAGVAGLLAGLAVGALLALLDLDGLGLGGAYLAAASVLPQSLAVIAGAVLRGRGFMVPGILAELGSVPALAALVIAARATTTGVTLNGAIAGYLMAAVVTASWSVPLAVRASGAKRSTGVADPWGLWHFLTHRASMLAAMMGASVVFYAITWAPVIVLSIAGRVEDVALVTVAARLANIVTLVPSIQTSYLAPRFSTLYHSRRIDDLNTLARHSSRHALALVAVPAALLALAAPVVLDLLYGPEFVAAAPALVWLVLGAVISVVMGQVSTLLLICDLERSGFVLTLVLVLVWATLGLWLAGRGGVVHVAALSAGATAVFTLSGSALLRRRRRIRTHA